MEIGFCSVCLALTWRMPVRKRDTKQVHDRCGNSITAVVYDKAAVSGNIHAYSLRFGILETAQRNIFYDFANPTSAVGDASIMARVMSSSQGYEREHIYELQSSAL